MAMQTVYIIRAAVVWGPALVDEWYSHRTMHKTTSSTNNDMSGTQKTSWRTPISMALSPTHFLARPNEMRICLERLANRIAELIENPCITIQFLNELATWEPMHIKWPQLCVAWCLRICADLWVFWPNVDLSSFMIMSVHFADALNVCILAQEVLEGIAVTIQMLANASRQQW